MVGNVFNIAWQLAQEQEIDHAGYRLIVNTAEFKASCLSPAPTPDWWATDALPDGIINNLLPQVLNLREALNLNE